MIQRAASIVTRMSVVVGAVWAVGGFTSTSSAAWSEDFSTVSDATLLQNLTGWSKQSGLDAYVTTAAGLTNRGIAFPSNGGGANSYVKSLTTTEMVTAADTGIGFSFAFNANSTSYTLYSMEFGDSDAGASNHFTIGFSAGSLTSGAATLGSYSANTWYQVSITGITLSNTSQGDMLSASLSMYALDASGNIVSTVINSASITAVGSGQAFDKIDYIKLASPWYTGGHTLALDNFGLTSGVGVPEPASLGFVGVMAAGLLMRQRRK